MKTATLITIETILEADRSIPRAKKEKVMDILLDRSPPPPPKKKKLITTKQAAEIIGIHPVSMRKLGQQGKIPVIRFSARKLRYDLEDIEAYAQGIGYVSEGRPARRPRIDDRNAIILQVVGQLTGPPHGSVKTDVVAVYID